MLEDLGLIIMKGYEDRGQELNNYICELSGEKKDYIIKIENPRFSNGESKVLINESVRNKDLYIIADIGNYSCVYNLYGNRNHMSPDDHYIDIVRALSAVSGKAKRVTLVLPLMYASRQHRRKGRESLDCAMALRYFESLGVNNIITFDIHDPEIQNTLPFGSFDSIFPIYAVLRKFLVIAKNDISKEKMVVISPDSGAIERSKKYASLLNLDLGMFYKRRDYTRVVDGKNPIIQHEYIGPDVTGKSILIVDDMLSSGESVIDVANNLKARGCTNVYVITTFAFFTNGTLKFDELYKTGIITKVFSTNASYINEEIKTKEWFSEVDITPILAELVVSLNNNKSISTIINPTEKIRELMNILYK